MGIPEIKHKYLARGIESNGWIWQCCEENDDYNLNDHEIQSIVSTNEKNHHWVLPWILDSQTWSCKNWRHPFGFYVAAAIPTRPRKSTERVHTQFFSTNFVSQTMVDRALLSSASHSQF